MGWATDYRTCKSINRNHKQLECVMRGFSMRASRSASIPKLSIGSPLKPPKYSLT